jgi:hypothetical protein
MNSPTNNQKGGATCVKFAKPAELNAICLEIAEMFESVSDIRIAVIDGALIGGKSDVLAAFASQFAFPEYFGHNWDALEECLSDLSWLKSGLFLVLIREPLVLFGKLTSDTRTLIEVLGNTCRFWNLIWPKMHGQVQSIHFACVFQCRSEERGDVVHKLKIYWPAGYIEGLNGLLGT